MTRTRTNSKRQGEAPKTRGSLPTGVRRVEDRNTTNHRTRDRRATKGGEENEQAQEEGTKEDGQKEERGPSQSNASRRTAASRSEGGRYTKRWETTTGHHNDEIKSGHSEEPSTDDGGSELDGKT